MEKSEKRLAEVTWKRQALSSFDVKRSVRYLQEFEEKKCSNRFVKKNEVRRR